MLDSMRWIFDFTPWIPEFSTWILDSGFQSLAGISDSTRKTFLYSGLHYWCHKNNNFLHFVNKRTIAFHCGFCIQVIWTHNFSKSKTTIVLYKLSRETDLYNHRKLIRWFFRSLWHFVDVFSIISRRRLCWARVPVLHEIQESIDSKQYHGKDTKGLEKENHYFLLTIEVTRATNTDFLPTTSADQQELRLWELIKWLLIKREYALIF